MRTAYLKIVFCLLLFVAFVTQHQTTAQEGENLLQNPGFEGEYFAWSGINEAQVAHGWTPWWNEDAGHNPAYFRPEYKRALKQFFPNRVMSGDSAQQWFTFHASHEAGMYQQVSNVQPGQTYRFSIWAQVWSSSSDEVISRNPSNPRLKIGIDPNGGWNPWAGTVVWSNEGSMDQIIDRWGYMSIDVVAQTDTITVFMRTNPDFASKHNDMYWDNGSLTLVGPPPTNTPLPTNTPRPVTNTPIPTATEIPTDTPEPTATAVPTETPEPTETAVPTETATNTPEPTETVIPTETVEPTVDMVAQVAEPTAVVATVDPTKERENNNLILGSGLFLAGLGLGICVALLFVLLKKR